MATLPRGFACIFSRIGIYDVAGKRGIESRGAEMSESSRVILQLQEGEQVKVQTTMQHAVYNARASRVRPGLEEGKLSNRLYLFRSEDFRGAVRYFFTVSCLKSSSQQVFQICRGFVEFPICASSI